MSDFTDDLDDDLNSVFFSDFCDTATVNGGTIEGIFISEDSSFFDGAKPTFQAPSVRLVGVRRGDALTINGSQYAVVNIDFPDSRIRLILGATNG